MKIRHIIDSPKFDRRKFQQFWESRLPAAAGVQTAAVAGRNLALAAADPDLAAYVRLNFFPAAAGGEPDAVIHLLRWTADLQLPVPCNYDNVQESYQYDDGDYSFFMRPAMGYFQSYCASTRTGICCFRESYMAKAVLALFWWARSSGAALIHCAAAGQEGRGVLLCGKSGQGKSTTALSCLAAGMDFVSDDCLILKKEADGKLTAYPVYTSLRLKDTSLDICPQLRGHAYEERFCPPKEVDAKTEYLLTEVFPGHIRPLEVCGIILPQVDSGRREPMLEPWPGAPVKLPLIYSTLQQFYDEGDEVLTRRLFAMLSRLPCQKLYLSCQYRKNAAGIRNYLKNAASAE